MCIEGKRMIKRKSEGVYGDPNGYEEVLYKNEKDSYFLYTYGGPESPYPEEKLVRISKAKAEEWLAKNN